MSVATISDTGPASAARLNQALRNLGRDTSQQRTTSQGFEVDDEVMEEYERLRDEGGNDGMGESPDEASQRQAQQQGQDQGQEQR